MNDEQPKQVNYSKQDPDLKPDGDEIATIAISLGLTALAATIIFEDKMSFPIQLVCLVIYILGGLATSFLYFTFLVNKIPETMNNWASKGMLNAKGIIWITKYYIIVFLNKFLL